VQRGYVDNGAAGGRAVVELVVVLLLVLLLLLLVPLPLPLPLLLVVVVVGGATGGALTDDSEGNVGDKAAAFVAPPLLLGGISARPVNDCVL
jgi:hypothetical protein